MNSEAETVDVEIKTVYSMTVRALTERPEAEKGQNAGC